MKRVLIDRKREASAKKTLFHTWVLLAILVILLVFDIVFSFIIQTRENMTAVITLGSVAFFLLGLAIYFLVYSYLIPRINYVKLLKKALDTNIPHEFDEGQFAYFSGEPISDNRIEYSSVFIMVGEEKFLRFLVFRGEVVSIESGKTYRFESLDGVLVSYEEKANG